MGHPHVQGTCPNSQRFGATVWRVVERGVVSNPQRPPCGRGVIRFIDLYANLLCVSFALHNFV